MLVLRNASTADEASPVAAGFRGVTLRGYQERNLHWMLGLERHMAHGRHRLSLESVRHTDVVQLGRSGAFLRLSEQRISATNEWKEFQTESALHLLPEGAPSMFDEELPITGGILCDSTGSGKTASILALVHTHRLQRFDQLILEPEAEEVFGLSSRATVVLVHSQLAAQWYLEAKKILPPDAKIHLITTIVQLRKLSWSDVIFADVLIVSYEFLKNKNYSSMFPPKADAVRAMTSEELQRTGKVHLGVIYFWRLVHDEIHELPGAKGIKAFTPTDICACWGWGLTATMPVHTPPDVAAIGAILCSPMGSWVQGKVTSVRQRDGYSRNNKVSRRREDKRVAEVPLLQAWVDVAGSPQ